MSTSLIGTAAHGLGSIRVERHAISGQGRIVDGLGKLAGWIGRDHAVAAPWPGARLEADLSDRIHWQMWADIDEPHVHECFNAIHEPGSVYFDVGAHIGFRAAFAAFELKTKNGSSALKRIRKFTIAWPANFPHFLGRRSQTRRFGTTRDRLRSSALPPIVNQAGAP
jgi:hypothetical protein